jgi:N-acetylglucosaminyldiphosphoundecaprenol N-acetyl-beta-D-mannosaminyltransferase
MPLVWASRLQHRHLPERVTGADLVPALSARAAAVGHRVFLLGGEPGVAEAAARRLQASFPTLHIAASGAPRFQELTADDTTAMIERVRKARADLLFLACSQPLGEHWLADHHEHLGVPVCVQVGAAIDFAAGRLSRAPRCLQRAGLEWAYRLFQEPQRLAGRYFRNWSYFLQSLRR